MRYTISTLLVLFSASAHAATPATLPSTQPWVIAHEWGTFTSFAGSDGINLEFRPTNTQPLPRFVRDAQHFDPTQQNAQNAALFSKSNYYSYERMETPVIYFYSDQETNIQVDVHFPKGLLTEFYPPARELLPTPTTQPAKIANGYLRWGGIHLIPAKDVIREAPPRTSGDDQYAFARETDSDMIRLIDQTNGANYFEKFLFYRGVGNFHLPMKLSSTGNDHFSIDIGDSPSIHAAFLVEIKAGQLRFAELHNLAPMTDVQLSRDFSSESVLADRMTRYLVAEGLYEKEAAAMVKTWRSSWLGQDGTRLLYLLPRQTTDELLPLTLIPAPKEVVRVMVGRQEVMTVETEHRIDALLNDLVSPDEATRQTATNSLKTLGRFAAPSLTRAVALNQNPKVRAAAELLLHDIQSN